MVGRGSLISPGVAGCGVQVGEATATLTTLAAAVNKVKRKGCICTFTGICKVCWNGQDPSSMTGSLRSFDAIGSKVETFCQHPVKKPELNMECLKGYPEVDSFFGKNTTPN